MSPPDDLRASFALLACAWLALALATSAAVALVWPWLHHRALGWHPRDRARMAWWAAVAPAVMPTSVLLLCVAPGIAGFASRTGDHCRFHLDHAHLCLFHASLEMSAPLWGGVVVLVACLGRAIWNGLRWTRTTRAAERHLCGDLRAGPSGQVERIDSDEPFAFTGGFLRPRVRISTALEDLLSPSQRAVVLAHEQAHARRRDPARFALAGLLSELHAPARRRSILSTLRLAAEQTCDEYAAGVAGSRLDVAETLLRVERLIRDRRERRPLLLAGVAGSSTLAARVRSLLLEAPPASEAFVGRALFATLLVAAPFVTVPIHHAAEHVVELIVRLL
ncbi:MAG: M56 family metallopeptidase [Deltaproteobacteria bacterium]|nr:M56 family metallopeptidase [Deltaproteobacteria bacterium]